MDFYIYKIQLISKIVFSSVLKLFFYPLKTDSSFTYGAVCWKESKREQIVKRVVGIGSRRANEAIVGRLSFFTPR